MGRCTVMPSPWVPGRVPAVSPRPECEKSGQGRGVHRQVAEPGRRLALRAQAAVCADLSVTVTQLSALLAARDAGINVPEATIGRPLDYVKKSQNADGGFRYLIQGGDQRHWPARRPRWPCSSVPASRTGRRSARDSTISPKFPPSAGIGQPELFYFYGHYYAAHAISHAGPQTWNRWYPAVRDGLLAQQIQDGSWPDAASVDLGTAMVCLTLQTKGPAPAGK